MVGRPLARVRLILVDSGKTWLCQRTTHHFDGACLANPSPRTALTGRSAAAWETWYTAKHVGRSYFPPPGRDPGVWQRAKPDSAYKRCKPVGSFLVEFRLLIFMRFLEKKRKKMDASMMTFPPQNIFSG